MATHFFALAPKAHRIFYRQRELRYLLIRTSGTSLPYFPKYGNFGQNINFSRCGHLPSHLKYWALLQGDNAIFQYGNLVGRFASAAQIYISKQFLKNLVSWDYSRQGPTMVSSNSTEKLKSKLENFRGGF